MRKIFFTFLMVIVFTKSFGQTNLIECGTVLTEEAEKEISEKLSFYDMSDARQENLEVYRVAISAHIIRRSNGTGGLTVSQLNQAISKVNTFYASAGLEFFIFDQVHFIDSDAYFDFNADNENALANSRDIDRTINIYFVNSLSSDGSALCGYAYFPGGDDRILMANSCTTNGTTLSHEIGHFLTLYHTHGKTNNGTTDELVNGSNCETAGDNICDTAADPNLSGKVDANCIYNLNEADANGQRYAPDPENVMSYAPASCRRVFTPGQFSRARQGYLVFRNYLLTTDYVAGISVESNVACVGEEVQFNNKSLGNVQSVLWEFDGGSPATSTSLNPKISYNVEGEYDVTLTVFGSDGGSDQIVIQNSVKVQQPSPELSFGEDFEESLISDFNIFSVGDTYSFETSTTGFNSSGSMKMDFYNYDNIGAKDYFVFAQISDLNPTDLKLSLDYSYTYRLNEGVSETFDEFSIVYKGCNGWYTLWQSDKKNTATASARGNLFVPASSEEWKHLELYVPIPEGENFVQLALLTTNGGGNALYIDNISVQPSDKILIRSLSLENLECAGDFSGKIDVSASYNGNEIQYSINGVDFLESGLFENLNTGNYTISIKSGDELIEMPVSITAKGQLPGKPFIILVDNTLKILQNEKLIEWFRDGELISSGTSTAIPFQGSGTYIVTVTNAAGCSRTSEPFIVLGLTETNAFSVYPNPVEEMLTVSLKRSIDAKVSVYNIAGELIRSVKTNSSIEIDFSDVESGIYVLRLESGGLQYSQLVRKK